MRLILTIGNYLFTILLCILLGFNLFSLYQRSVHQQQFPMAFGFGYAIVASGSMEPTLAWGDLVVVHHQKNYEVSDIITFKQSGDVRPTTHRIVSIDKQTILTQGDANDSRDAPIAKNQIFGKAILTIPYVGYFIQFVSSPLGILSLFCLLFLNVFLSKRTNE